MENLSSEKINNLRSNARSMVRELGLLNDAYFEIGVTLAERHLLLELSVISSPTMGEIADRLLLDKSTVSRLISKATQKGYISISVDEKDQRKRFLHLTELGRRTLDAFEPIAFHQTKQALMTLSPQEINTVYEGIALYVKGLKASRMQNQQQQSLKISSEKNFFSQEFLGEIYQEFLDKNISLRLFEQKDEKELYEIFKGVVETGAEFPYESSSMQEFHRQFFAMGTKVYILHRADEQVVGGFYIKANYSGRSSHIANAAYMIDSKYRGLGIGKLMVRASLKIAKGLGFRSLQFNMVLSGNKIAINLYKNLGFEIAGTLPEAVRNPDGSYQDGLIMLRSLKDQ